VVEAAVEPMNCPACSGRDRTLLPSFPHQSSSRPSS